VKKTTKTRHMNILLTGCTSPQCNPKTNRSVNNFAGLLRKALQAAGHDVYWQEPSILWRTKGIFERFDHVIVGLAPVTSLSANRVYGALSVLDEALIGNANRVSILLDAPEPARIAASFRAILSHPANLVKPFYSYRQEYAQAVVDRDRLLKTIERLCTQPWPNVIMPQLPWESRTGIEDKLPYQARRLTPLNLDQLLLDDMLVVEPRPRRAVWAVEGHPHQVTTLPREIIPRKGHAAGDAMVLAQLASSIGCLIEEPRFGGWWNTRYAQSLSVSTPVFSEWRSTSQLGDAWSRLPGPAETMSPMGRAALAAVQLDWYRMACPNEEAIQDDLIQMFSPRSYALKGA
jgi:hypothetical protein